MRNLHNLRSSDSNISMNHDMTKTERERIKHLVDKAREMNKQEHMGEWFYKVRGPPWEKKILKIRKSELTVNRNNVTYQYTNRNVSLNKLFCMYTNADCLSNKLNELKSVIDSCDTHPHLIGVCEIKPENFRFTPSTTEFMLPGYSLFQSNVDTQNWRGVSLYISNISTATPIVLCYEFCECVWVSMPLTQSGKLLIGRIYRSSTQQCDRNNAGLCNMP